MNIAIYTTVFAQGIVVTLAGWLITSVVSLALGTLLGIVSCRYLGYKDLSNVVRVYTFVAKGIPAYVQILIFYFVLPGIFNISVSGFGAACCALSFCSSGYTAEIVRAGINMISIGQWDACKALGYSLRQTLTRIILPQTFRSVVAMLCNESESILKSTSLFAAIGVTEITRTGMNIISRELNPLPVYCIIACIYLCFAALINGALIYSERRFSYGSR